MMGVAGDLAGNGEESTSPPDRCPYPRPFPPDFSSCPTYQAVAFMAADSQNRRLGSWLTCRHLTSGSGQQSGRYYPRCALGSKDERLRWLTLVGPTRLAVVRALQKEFDEFSWPHREKLFDTKADLLASPLNTDLRYRLELLVRSFLGQIDVFLDEREERFREAGLPTEPLRQLLGESLWGWVHTWELESSYVTEERLRAFPPQYRAFLGLVPETVVDLTAKPIDPTPMLEEDKRPAAGDLTS